jgi:hypothetical protein
MNTVQCGKCGTQFAFFQQDAEFNIEKDIVLVQKPEPFNPSAFDYAEFDDDFGEKQVYKPKVNQPKPQAPPPTWHRPVYEADAAEFSYSVEFRIVPDRWFPGLQKWMASNNNTYYSDEIHVRFSIAQFLIQAMDGRTIEEYIVSEVAGTLRNSIGSNSSEAVEFLIEHTITPLISQWLEGKDWTKVEPVDSEWVAGKEKEQHSNDPS